MTFGEARAMSEALNAEVSRTGATLRAFPRSAMGLVPEAVRATDEYRNAKAASDLAFANLRRFNAVYTKRFAVELRAERQAKHDGL